MSNLRERIRNLRAEATGLEETAVEQDRTQGLLDALQRERASQQQRLAFGLQLGDRLERVPDPAVPGALRPGERTGHDIAEKAQQRIDNIDVELNKWLQAPLAR